MSPHTPVFYSKFPFPRATHLVLSLCRSWYILVITFCLRCLAGCRNNGTARFFRREVRTFYLCFAFITWFGRIFIQSWATPLVVMWMKAAMRPCLFPGLLVVAVIYCNLMVFACVLVSRLRRRLLTFEILGHIHRSHVHSKGRIIRFVYRDGKRKPALLLGNGVRLCACMEMGASKYHLFICA